ncbi:MAG: spore coat protein [Firmicutes bacterium]|nr:spore coat protein [Bacillota bacterium]
MKNPSTGVPKVKGPQFNDRDIANDLLATEKYLTNNYNDFAREASHRDLHNLVMGILNDSHQAARDVFNLMFKNGWYNLTSTTRQSLQQTKDQFTNYQAQFPYSGEMH